MNAAWPNAEESQRGTRDWPRAPPHRLAEAGVYFVTARTLDRIAHFRSPDRLGYVRDRLLELAAHYGWRLEAWAVLANHYHFVGHSPAAAASAESLRRFIKHFHADITRQMNRLDGLMARKLWHNYRETHLTFQPSYLARLHYTHTNAVHHRLVSVATAYEWCSARSLETACTPAWIKTIYSFAYDEIAQTDQDND